MEVTELSLDTFLDLMEMVRYQVLIQYIIMQSLTLTLASQYNSRYSYVCTIKLQDKKMIRHLLAVRQPR